MGLTEQLTILVNFLVWAVIESECGNSMVNCAACLHAAQEWASWNCQMSCSVIPADMGGGMNISALDEKIQQLEARVQSLENSTAYSFSTRLSASAAINANPFKFDIVDHNLGGGYDSSSGDFTAPVSGIYFFSVYANSNGAYGKVFIKRNSDTLCHTQVTTETNINNVCSAVTSLNQGDLVRVMGVAASTGNIVQHISGFVGHLIQKT